MHKNRQAIIMRNQDKQLQGSNQARIQEINRMLILRLLKRKGVCSRVELARLTGLKQATITNIMNDFIRLGLVRESGLLTKGKGRHAIGVMLREDAFYVIGLRLTRQFFRVGLFNTAGTQVDHRQYAIPEGQKADEVMRRMIKAIADMRAAHSSCPVMSAGISVPGPYYPRLGKIMAVTEFQGWENICIRDEFEKALDIPVILEHDANVGVLAEWWGLSLEKQNSVMVYLAVGQGVGAGIVENGKIFKGAYGTAGEIGHISMNALGERCACNNRGCLTGYASTIGFRRRVAQEIQTGTPSSLQPGFSFEELVQAVKAGDPASMKVFKEDLIRYLGTMLVNLIWTYSPDEIVIGDEMAALGDVLIDALKQFVREHTMSYLTEWTNIRLSCFLDDPAYLGCADLAADLIWENPKLWEQIAPAEQER